MKAEKYYEILFKTIKKNTVIENMYCLFEGCWNEVTSSKKEKTELDEELVKILNNVLSKRYIENNGKIYVMIDNFSIIKISCNEDDYNKKFYKYSKIIRDSVKHSEKYYLADYDQLTGLMNARVFRENLIKSINKLPENKEKEEKEKTDVDSSDKLSGSDHVKKEKQKNLALLMMDIDKFKQINDSYGHEYGDAVIKCFAKRINLAIKRLRSSKLRIELGRYGGDEFKAFVFGEFDLEDIKKIAEKIRKSISDRVLPDDDEWNEEEIKRDEIKKSERELTTSIGVSKIIESKPEDIEKCLSDLNNESDLALYRAKAAGRNEVKCFSEIKDNSGSIINYHEETGNITIDIGENVEVHVGDEFHVFHPDFTGAKDYELNDGRSTKVLGSYPKTIQGEIVVYDVQKEISFCKKSKDEYKEEFTVGSYLKNIPIGSIEMDYNFKDKSEIDSFLSKISKESPQSTSCFVVSLFFGNLDEVEKKETVNIINTSIKNVVNEFTKLSPLKYICRIDRKTFSFVYLIKNKDVDNIEEELFRTLSLCSKKTNALFELGCAFIIGKDFIDLPNDKSSLSFDFSLIYSEYISKGLLVENEMFMISKYDPLKFSSYLGKLREKREFDEALNVYNNLIKAGVNNAYVHNNMSVSYYLQEQYFKALNASQKAYELLDSEEENKDIYIVPNYAVYLCLNKKWSESYSIFKEAEKVINIDELDIVYRYPYVISKYKKGEKIRKSEIDWVREGVNDNMGVFFHDISDELIEKIITP